MSAAYKVADVSDPDHQNSKSYFIEFQLRENTALENLSKSNTIIDTEHHTVKLFVNFCKFKEEDWQNPIQVLDERIPNNRFVAKKRGWDKSPGL